MFVKALKVAIQLGTLAWIARRYLKDVKAPASGGTRTAAAGVRHQD